MFQTALTEKLWVVTKDVSTSSTSVKMTIPTKVPARRKAVELMSVTKAPTKGPCRQVIVHPIQTGNGYTEL